MQIVLSHRWQVYPEVPAHPLLPPVQEAVAVEVPPQAEVEAEAVEDPHPVPEIAQ